MFFDIIVAHQLHTRIIGKNQTIPWHLPEDLKWFKHLTASALASAPPSYPASSPPSHSSSSPSFPSSVPPQSSPQSSPLSHVIMGRRTWESLPGGRPLPNRRHWIVSKSVILTSAASAVSSLEDALTAIRAESGNYARVFVIGGEALYAEALLSPWCRYIYETVVHPEVSVEPGDTLAYFPEIPKEYDRIRTGVYETSKNGIQYHRDVWERKRPVLWWIDPSCYESDWLNLCLFHVPHYSYSPTLSVVPNAIIIANQLSQYRNIFKQYEILQVPYHLIHLSDEYLDDDTSCYAHNACQTVFRNYLHPVYLNHPKVISFGIGYRNGFSLMTPEDFHYSAGFTDSPYLTGSADFVGSTGSVGFAGFAKRTFVWSFAGYIKKSDRTQILNLFKVFQPNAIHETSGFNQGILAPNDYAAVMRESKFVVCPVGNCSIDTFRLYEALEAGAIPVTLFTNVNQPFVRFIGHYWNRLFNSPTFLCNELPWVMSHTWEENVVKVRALLADPEALDTLRSRLVIFWKNYKTHLATLFQHRLASHEPAVVAPV